MNAVELSLEELYKGKATMIKDNKYRTTQQYIEPFIDRVSKFTDEFIIKALPASQISLTPNGEIPEGDVVYNRVWVQGVLPEEYAYDNHKQSINMLYALDTRKPLVKIFKNTVNMACLNMCVFNPEHLEVQELAPESAINYRFVDRVGEMADSTRMYLEQLSKMEISREDMFDQLGRMVDRCIGAKFQSNFGTVKVPESLPIDAYKSVFYDTASPYFTNEGGTTGFNLYNAFTNIISNDKGKDIVNKFEKIYMVAQIMGLK